MDWFHYRTIWHSLPQSMKRVGEAVGVDDSFLFRCMKGFSRPNEASRRTRKLIQRLLIKS
jgi:hypothetical protein